MISSFGDLRKQMTLILIGREDLSAIAPVIMDAIIQVFDPYDSQDVIVTGSPHEVFNKKNYHVTGGRQDIEYVGVYFPDHQEISDTYTFAVKFKMSNRGIRGILFRVLQITIQAGIVSACIMDDRYK